MKNLQEITKHHLLNELKKYVEILDEHYSTLEKLKIEGEDIKLLTKVINNVRKLIVRNSNKLAKLEENDEWRNNIITELEQDRKLWWGIGESYTISEFKKLVGVEKFNELLKN